MKSCQQTSKFKLDNFIKPRVLTKLIADKKVLLKWHLELLGSLTRKIEGDLFVCLEASVIEVFIRAVAIDWRNQLEYRHDIPRPEASFIDISASWPNTLVMGQVITCRVNCGGEITHQFPNFNGSTVEVLEWIRNFILMSAIT